MRSRLVRPVPFLCALLLLALGCQSAGSAREASGPGFQGRLLLSDETRERVYDVPPQGGGPVTPYQLQLGSLVESYASRTAEGVLAGAPAVDVEVEIDDFRVRAYQAFAELSFRVSRDDELLFERSYEGRGRRRALETDLAGSFELRQGVDLTTDGALRSVFGQFARDVSEAKATW